MKAENNSAAVLQTIGLTVALRDRADAARVVDGLDLALRAGETLAIVGESGSGKSMTALAIMRLLPDAAEIVAGSRVMFEGRDLTPLSERDMERIRGAKISMIFQEPMTSLNPVLRIGAQIAEVFEAHRQDLSRRAARICAADLLDLVRIPDSSRVLDAYPHQLSGGMRQRVMIAMALACQPRVLIADEPTTALDATVQAQILDLLLDLRSRLGVAILLITHNLGVVAGNADRVMVMYAGRVVEDAPVSALFRAPLHPYAKGLLAAVPDPRRVQGGERPSLREIPGSVPALTAMPPGCAFAPRCPEVLPRCLRDVPALERAAAGRSVACFAAPKSAEPAA